MTGRIRLNADPEEVGRGLSRLVVVVLELLRELLERQAIRRLDGGDLTAEQVENLGRALLEIRSQLEELRASLDVSEPETQDILARAGRLLDSDRMPNPIGFEPSAAGRAPLTPEGTLP